jgi:hypothetical protein
MERFSLKKPNEVEGREQFCVQESNKSTALEDLDTEVEISNAWETEYQNFSQKESRLLQSEES